MRYVFIIALAMIAISCEDEMMQKECVTCYEVVQHNSRGIIEYCAGGSGDTTVFAEQSRDLRGLMCEGDASEEGIIVEETTAFLCDDYNITFQKIVKCER